MVNNNFMLVEGLQLPFGVQPVNPVPVSSWEGPYVSVSEANSSIPLAVRFPTMEVRILDAINGNKKYWYKDGVADNDLVDVGADVSAALTNEINARISGDTILNNLITGLTQTVDGNYVYLNNSITGETTGRIAADIILHNEITGLTTAVGDNYTSLYNQLTGETLNRITGDTNQYNLLTGETTNRTNADANLQAQINNEVTGRTAADIILNNQITGLTTTVNDNYNTLYNLSTGETANRTAADIVLQNEITGLTAIVGGNYTSLYNQLTGETYNRITGDTSLYVQLTGETAERIAADLELHDFITGQTATIHQQNTDNTLLSPDKTKTVVFTDNGGNFHITGNLIQTGGTYETHVNHVYTTGNTITLRDGAIAGMSPGEYAGFLAKLYDGVNDGVIHIGADGVVRVGDVGNTQAIATREDNPTNDYLVKWSSGNTRFETIIRNTSSIPPSVDRNYLTDLELTKLNGVQSGAQVNLIEVIKLNGIVQTISGKTVDMTVQTSVVTDNTLTGVGTIGDPLSVNVSNLGVYTSGQTDTLLDTKYPYSNPSGFTSNLGTVTDVSGTLPIVVTGGTTPVVSINAATQSLPGSMSSTDKTKLDGIESGAQVNVPEVAVQTSAPITGSTFKIWIDTDAPGTAVVQLTGTSTSSVMSQNAVTDAINASNEVIIGGSNPGAICDIWIDTAASGLTVYTQTEINTLLLEKVGTGLTINGHQLTNNVTVTANETGAYTSGQTDTLLLGKSNTGHTHSQYLTGYTETNPGVYTSGQTDTLLLNKVDNNKRNMMSVSTSFVSNTSATISPDFDGVTNSSDTYKVDSNYAGGATVSISSYTNLPTFDILKNVIVKNSKASDVTYTFTSVAQVSGGITYSFLFMGGSSAASILVPTLKTLDTIYTFEFTSPTTCIVSIIYTVEK